MRFNGLADIEPNIVGWLKFIVKREGYADADTAQPLLKGALMHKNRKMLS